MMVSYLNTKYIVSHILKAETNLELIEVFGKIYFKVSRKFEFKIWRTQ